MRVTVYRKSKLGHGGYLGFRWWSAYAWFCLWRRRKEVTKLLAVEAMWGEKHGERIVP